MDFIRGYAIVLFSFQLLSIIFITVRASGMEDKPKEEQDAAKIQSSSAMLSFCLTLPVYLRAVGLI